MIAASGNPGAKSEMKGDRATDAHLDGIDAQASRKDARAEAAVTSVRRCPEM
jgi:hypothetical protein